jgi:hypothetical protein
MKASLAGRYDSAYALWQNTRWSRRKIAPFVRRHGIDMSQFEPGQYESYNDFFVRGCTSASDLSMQKSHFLLVEAERYRHLAERTTDREMAELWRRVVAEYEELVRRYDENFRDSPA